MLGMPIVTAQWHICPPPLFRYLENKYVDAFFNDGTLRLSSFAQFKKHNDEQRQDKHEGEAFFVEQTNHGSGQTIEIFSSYGDNAYILSSCMRYDKKLAELFSCDSYIKINDTTNFGIAVAQQIPLLMAGFEGPCVYRSAKILAKDMEQPPKDIQQFKNKDGLVDISKLTDSVTGQHPSHLPYFLKDNAYATQVEYRFVWITKNPVEEPLTIKVPQAVQFCEKPNTLNQ